MSVVTGFFDRHVDLRVKNTTQDTVELIYEIPRSVFEKKQKGVERIEDKLYEIEHIQYVNVVSQDDDISG